MERCRNEISNSTILEVLCKFYCLRFSNSGPWKIDFHPSTKRSRNSVFELTCNLLCSSSIYRYKNKKFPERKSFIVQLDWKSFDSTLKSWTPIQANMNCRRNVTSMMFPMVFIATTTHWTTCCTRKRFADFLKRKAEMKCFTFKPLARLMARNGLSTRRTRRILTTEIARSLMTIEISETETTTISKILKRFRQNAPGWRIKP